MLRWHTRWLRGWHALEQPTQRGIATRNEPRPLQCELGVQVRDVPFQSKARGDVSRISHHALGAHRVIVDVQEASEFGAGGHVHIRDPR